ncbi:MAG TPA: hybrid sensor histidine kinase/response regulator [Prolixibacteraceae bacterium]|jgi:signal transduction histidine kinase/ligand-binding sensor domain-containing protein/CheY-like chemotaxis protein|nr:hybrid sensor histidine kinase/response regulator [Prolixibacteraceae bacterium]
MKSTIFKILKYRIITILLFCLAYTSNAFAVEFYSVNSIYGISMRVTNSICKDNNGFIWASSKTGILRLADDDYRIYHLPYEAAGAIVVKLIYQNSKLTAYTNNGQVFLYNPVYDRFDLLFDIGKKLKSYHFDLINLLMDHSGDYWIALSSGLYRYHSNQLYLIDENLKESCSITWFDEQHLIVTRAGGIWLLDTQTLKSKCLYETKNIKGFAVSTFFLDRSQNKLWMGTFSNGLYCYSFSSGTLSQILQSTLPRQPILAIEENSNSTLLVGIDGQGVWELDKKGNEVLNVYKESADDPHSLRGNGVYDIYYDHDKRVWIGTISGGLSFFDQASPLVNQIIHHTNNTNSLVNNDVNGITEDRNGKIWFATNNGISCWDPLSDKWKNFYCNKLEQAQVFLTLCEDDQGRIWAGSYSSGVYVLDEKTGQELAHYSRGEKGNPKLSNFIFDIYKDSQGDLWIGGINGEVVCYLSKENKFKSFSEEPISSFAELSSGQILLGCSYGILLLDKQSGEIRNLLSEIVVQDMLVLGEDIWICTSGEGLLEYNFKSKTLKKYTAQSGLPSNFINSIGYADHYLWLGTEGGLCRFDPKEKTTLTFSSIFPLSIISYNKSSIYPLKDGKLAWGTNNGAVVFAPESLREIPSKGRIFFQDLTVSGRSIRDISTFGLNTPVDSLKSINLKYFQNTISLELFPIGISSSAKFSWKMEGFDREWSPPTSNRIITYTNIPSGRFTLKVKLLDSSLAHVLSERSIAIHLVPPFWRTNGFWMLLFGFILGIILLYFLYYINRLKQKHTEEKVRFFTNTAHDIRTSLTLIKAPIEELTGETNLSEKGKYYLQLAVEQARQLTSVVTQLMDFQKVDIGKEQMLFSKVDIVNLITDRKVMFESFAKSKNVELTLLADRPSYITAIDASKMEKVIDNLISNAVKYSLPNSAVLIDLQCDDSKWVLQVKDQGIGISPKAQSHLFREFYRGDNAINSKVVGSGIGLLLVKEYVTLHRGKISYVSQEDVGSTFQIVIPFKEIGKDLKAVNTIPRAELAHSPSTDYIPKTSFVQEFHHGEIKVLIVEDNDDLLNLMRSTLEREFTIFTAVDGAQAWEFISKQVPDLVVSDVMMPHMDGFELCQLMKSTYETSHIPFIILSALSERGQQLHGLGLGADDYLTKPFDRSMLIERIKSIIRNRKAVREKALKIIKGDSSKRLFANELNDLFVSKMLEVARVNISNFDFNKEVFASAMNVSSSLLYKKTKSFTGLSPTDLIKTVRLDHALSLLQSQKYTVTEVSELCGFASVGYFSTVFRKHFGKSPTEVKGSK